MRLAYCSVDDVKARLFSASSQVNQLGSQLTPAANVDPQRDGLLDTLTVSVSRRFDEECGRPPEAFAPKYDVRLYSGIGSQETDFEEFATISKLELNTTPGIPETPTWTDLTPELTSGLTQIRPIRFWPKMTIFRMSTLFQDPFLAGNVRITGIFGNVQPDPGAAPPLGQTTPWFGLTDEAITALQPPAPYGGWWITPEDVRTAVAEWTTYKYLAGRGGFSDVQGNPGGGPMIYRKGMPPEVSMVIDKYTRSDPKIAMVTMNGEDLGMEAERIGTPGALSRWAAWQTFTP